MSQQSQFCPALTAHSFPHLHRSGGAHPRLWEVFEVKLFPSQGAAISQRSIPTMCCLSSLGLTRSWAVVAPCQEEALSRNILLVENKCLRSLTNSLCLGICHCITVSLKQSSVLQSSGSYGEAGPLKGSCSSQSNLLQG